MADQRSQPSVEPRSEPTGCLPGLLRLVWVLLGNAALFFFAVFIAMRMAPVVMDLAFLALVIGLLVVRYVDITKFKGETSEGQPATLEDWRRYAVWLAVGSAALWALARFVAFRGWL
jgi:hypothetical protein